MGGTAGASLSFAPNMSKFNIGDIVVTDTDYGRFKKGHIGTVTKVYISHADTYSQIDNVSVWINDYHLKLYKGKTTTMAQVNDLQKTMLSEDDQALVNAGIVYGDLSGLTDKGTSILWALLLNANKPAMVVRAKEIIAEQKANK